MMLGARGRKVRADLASNRARSLLAVACLAVGTIAVGATYLAGRTATASFTASFLAANPPSAVLRTTPLPETLVDQVRAHPEVGQAEGRRLLPAVATNADAGRVNVELVAMTDLATNEVARIDPRSGVWPPGEGELVVERVSLGELGVKLGETVRVEVAGGRSLELTVVGSTYDAWEMTPMFGGPARGYVSMDTMAALAGSRDLDALYLRALTDPLDRDRAIATAAAVRDDVLAPAGVAVRASAIQDPSVHRADNSLRFMTVILQLLSLFALVIAVALVLNTVAAVLAQQRRQLGVMKAVGGTSGQLTGQYLGYVGVLAAGAVVVALPLAVIAGRFVAGFMATLANFDLLALGIPWATIGVVVVVAVVVPLVAVVWSVRRAARISVQDAISDRGLTGPARRARVTLPLTRPARLAYRNAARNRTRLVLTILTVALCGGVLIGVMSTGVALGRLTAQVAGYWSYDVEVRLIDPVEAGEAAQVLGGDPQVEGVEGWYETQAFVIRSDGTENENLSITAAPPDSATLQPTLLEGRWFAPGDDHPIVVNTHTVDAEPWIEVGGRVMLDIEGQRREWQVVGVSSTTLVGPVAYVPVDELTSLLGVPDHTNLVAVRLGPGADQGDAASRLESAARQAGLPVAGVETNAQLRSVLDGLMALVVGPLLVVGAMLALVAVIGVAGVMTLGVMEQTREIGVLRTLGASSRAVKLLLLRQGLVIAGIGGALGVLASLPVAWLLRRAVSDYLVMTAMPVAFSWPGVAVWVVVALLIGAIGATQPARVAARLTIRDTLAYE
jgi:putative ABC transport system permease protein